MVVAVTAVGMVAVGMCVATAGATTIVVVFVVMMMVGSRRRSVNEEGLFGSSGSRVMGVASAASTRGVLVVRIVLMIVHNRGHLRENTASVPQIDGCKDRKYRLQLGCKNAA